MLKKVIILAIVTLFIASAIEIYAAQSAPEPTVPPMEKTKDRISRAMNNMLYGPTEVADNLSETKTKGTKIDRCSEKTRTGVERGIGRFFAGAWQLATFWYSDPGCVTSTKGASATKSKSK